MNLKTIGVFAFFDAMNGAQTGQLARKIEKLGYSALWFPEAFGREAFTHATYLLNNTEKLIVATGIANVYMREAITTGRTAKTLGELFPDRFILGLGLSNKAANAARGLGWNSKPLGFMQEYLSKMRAATYMAPAPKQEPPVVLAAVRPKMIQVAGAQTHGTHTYFVPPEHTRRTRAAIGPDKWICAEQAVVLEKDPAKARAAARAYLNFYLSMPDFPMRKVLAEFGFQEADFKNNGSDRLVDGIIAWGSEEQLRERIEAHYKAGATHVCILPIGRPESTFIPDDRVLEALAPRS